MLEHKISWKVFFSKNVQMMTLGWSTIFFMARSKLHFRGFIWEAIRDFAEDTRVKITHFPLTCVSHILIVSNYQFCFN